MNPPGSDHPTRGSALSEIGCMVIMHGLLLFLKYDLALCRQADTESQEAYLLFCYDQRRVTYRCVIKVTG